MNIHMYLLWQTKLAADYRALSFVVEIEDFFRNCQNKPSPLKVYMVAKSIWKSSVFCCTNNVFAFVSMLRRGTIGNKFWVMAQPSLHQGQHWAIVLLAALGWGGGQFHSIFYILVPFLYSKSVQLLDHLFYPFHSCWLCSLVQRIQATLRNSSHDKFLTLHSGRWSHTLDLQCSTPRC